MCVIVGHRNGCQIGKKGQEDHKVNTKSFIDDAHRGDQIDLQMEAESDTILNISFHALEDLSCNLDGADNGAKARSEEDDIGGGLHALTLGLSRLRIC